MTYADVVYNVASKNSMSDKESIAEQCNDFIIIENDIKFRLNTKQLSIKHLDNVIYINIEESLDIVLRNINKCIKDINKYTSGVKMRYRHYVNRKNIDFDLNIIRKMAKQLHHNNIYVISVLHAEYAFLDLDKIEAELAELQNLRDTLIRK